MAGGKSFAKRMCREVRYSALALRRVKSSTRPRGALVQCDRASYHPTRRTDHIGWWDAKSGDGMKRREFLCLLGAASAWPLSTRAQQPTTPLIGYLDGSGLPRWFEAFRHGMSDLGYVQGRTIAIE